MFYDSTTFCKGIVCSLITFITIHYVLSKMLSTRQQWKCINVSTSFLHSIFSSVLSIYCLIENPRMCTTDIISSFTSNGYFFISFEIGYFLFDSIDMLRNAPGRSTYEVLLHHVIIVGCFGISVVHGRYIGYAVLSLFIEINSIFLHLRQLFLFANKSKRDFIYRLNTILNLITFLIFRFGLIAYMSIWLFANRSLVPLTLCFIGQSGLLVMTIINLNLLYRVIKSDFFISSKPMTKK